MYLGRNLEQSKEAPSVPAVPIARRVAHCPVGYITASINYGRIGVDAN